jgi:dihydrofolate synthase/folylpolyglutamate synthase
MQSAKEQGINPSLEHVAAVCAAAGHPERAFVPIQIAGTNGKTSTARLIDALLRADGQHAALYTSPSLTNDTDRILIDGTPIATDALAAHLQSARTIAATQTITLTAFEEMTVACFLALRDAHVDFGVLEVGLGGRWDATSAAPAAVSVITGVALDHTDLLGDTVQAIARDKAHIIRPGSTVILGQSVGDLAPIFLERAHGFGLHPQAVAATGKPSPVTEALTTRCEIHDVSWDGLCRDGCPHPSATQKQQTDGSGDPSLQNTHFAVTTPHATYDNLILAAPAYQASNAATALAAAEAALGRALDPNKVRRALATLTFPGRFEVIRTNPLLIFDGAHNPQAARILADLIKHLPHKPIIALGVFADKDADGIIAALAPQAKAFIALEPPPPRALSAEALARKLKPSHVLAQITGMDALPQILEVTGDEPVIITGSLSLYSLLKSVR